MLAVISILCVIIAVALIIMVLLQPSKSGSVGGAFGSLNSSLGSTFGSRRTLDFLSKGTTYGAILLGSLCLLSNIFFIPHKGAAGAANPITTGATVPAGSVSAPPKPKLPSANSTAPAAAKETAPTTSDGKNTKQVNTKATETKSPETKK
ncbi:MAG: preprotein translocase subunit SecG [Chlorobiota bacterium]|jgi:preprotein translocase subunit SecG|nr:preprotein translocase subunit SecG [Chlorobiota bacterium]QQS66534.1 MAG: preprotein translocase subunit SecG [Chlorobiota bacterium]